MENKISSYINHYSYTITKQNLTMVAQVSSAFWIISCRRLRGILIALYILIYYCIVIGSLWRSDHRGTLAVCPLWSRTVEDFYTTEKILVVVAVICHIRVCCCWPQLYSGRRRAVVLVKKRWVGSPNTFISESAGEYVLLLKGHCYLRMYVGINV